MRDTVAVIIPLAFFAIGGLASLAIVETIKEQLPRIRALYSWSSPNERNKDD